MSINILKTGTNEEFFNEYGDKVDTINPRTGEKSQQQGLNLWKIKEKNPDADFIICIGDNSLGKSFSVEQGFCKEMLKGKKQNGIRNMKTEASRCVDAGKDILKRNGLADNYEVNQNGVYEKIKDIPIDINTDDGKNRLIKKSTKPKLGTLVLPFVYMSSPDSSTAPTEGLSNNCGDEFLSGNEKRKFVIKEPLKALRKLEKRNRAMFNENDGRVITFLLANPHTPEADILCDLYCDGDGEKVYNKENIYIKYQVILDDGSPGMTVIFTMITNIECVENEFLQKQLKRDKLLGITGYEYPHPSLKKIYPKPKNYEIILSFTYDIFDHTIYKDLDTNHLGIGKKTRESDGYPYYCIFQSDQNGANTYIPRSKDVHEIFYNVLYYRLNNWIRYQQPFEYEETKGFFEYLEGLRQSEEETS